MQRLKQKLSPNLPLITRLQRKAFADLFQALANAVESTFPHALFHIGRSFAHSKSLYHSQSVKERSLGICVDRERAVCCFGVHVNQGGVTASHNDDKGADWKLQ